MTILNHADALMLGEDTVDRVFLGSQQVWPIGFVSTLTIPSGKVASDLTNFVTKINLADMPDEWWDTYNPDVNAVRVRSGGSDVPLDIVSIDKATKTGEAFFKASLLAASNNVFTVEIVAEATEADVTDTNGRNAVWADYDFACIYTEWVDRTGQGHDPVLQGTTTGYAISQELNPTGNDQFTQGCAWDGTYWYSVGGSNNRRVEKWNAAGISQAAVVDLSTVTTAFNGLAFTHGSGCTVKGGELFISVSNGDSGGTNQHIVVLNLSDLSVNRIYDVSGHGEMSDICWNSDDSVFVFSDFFTDTRLHVFDDTFSSYSSLTLPGAGVADMQGIEWSGGKLLIMSGPVTGSSNLYTVNDDMSGTLDKIWTGPAHLQGMTLKSKVSATPDLWVADNDVLRKLTYTAGTTRPGWLSLSGNGNAEAGSQRKRTQWTYGATVIFPSVPVANRTILSYSSTTTTDSNRETLSIQSNGKWDLWDSTNAHISSAAAATSGDANVRHRISSIFDGTTARTMYRQGAQIATDPTVTQRPAGGTDGTMTLFMGAEDQSRSERWIGDMNYIYLRNGVLSANWLAAEYASWEGSSFYSIS